MAPPMPPSGLATAAAAAAAATACACACCASIAGVDADGISPPSAPGAGRSCTKSGLSCLFRGRFASELLIGKSFSVRSRCLNSLSTSNFRFSFRSFSV